MLQLNFVVPAEALQRSLELSVFIPALNEAGNVEPLLEKLGIALAGIK